MNRYSTLGAHKLADKRVSMGGALGHGLWAFVKHYVLQARLPRRLGRLRDRARKFRGHILPLCQALRGDAVLVTTFERAATAAVTESFRSLSFRSWGNQRPNAVEIYGPGSRFRGYERRESTPVVHVIARKPATQKGPGQSARPGPCGRGRRTRRRSRRGLDADLLHLRRRGLRHRYLQHALGDAGLDLVRVVRPPGRHGCSRRRLRRAHPHRRR